MFNQRFILITTVGAVVTGILTWLVTSSVFITPLYRSEALIYVPLTIPSRQIEQQGIGFASDIEIDGHIQIFQSARMRDSLIERYNLAQNLGVDLNETGGLSKLYEKIDSRIKFEKTRFSSVAVIVLNPDPILAAEMANVIVNLGDVIKEDILYENRRKALLQAQQHYENKLQNVQLLEHRIDSLDPSGTGRSSGNEIIRLKNQYATEIQELASRKNHLEMVERDFNTGLPGSYIISQAIPAASPHWPNRKLLVAGSVIAFIFFASVIEIVKQNAKSTG
jgi:uncharacterized protein involved in exopolysaccharide biosynthesis